MPESLFSLSQISELAEIPKETLYAWERRHKVVEPMRTGSRRRVYNGQQLARLKLLKACIDRGSRIGAIAHLSDESLRELLQYSEPAAGVSLTSLALSLDQDEIDTQLGIALLSMGVAAFADRVLAPRMADVGKRCVDNGSMIISEHLLSASAKSILFAGLRMNKPRAIRGSAVLATLEGEHHEIGLLSSALVAQSCGLRSVYLGPQLPTDLIVDAARLTGARLVMTSASVIDPHVCLNALRSMTEQLPRGVIVACGGAAFESIKMEIPHGTRFFESLLAFEEWLVTAARI